MSRLALLAWSSLLITSLSCSLHKQQITVAPPAPELLLIREGLSVLELADQGIRVSTVYPGATDTRIFDGVPGDWDRSAMSTPEEVAEVVWRAYWSPPGHDVADLEIPPPARPPAR